MHAISHVLSPAPLSTIPTKTRVGCGKARLFTNSSYVFSISTDTRMARKSSFCSIPLVVLLCLLCVVSGSDAEGGGVMERRVKREHRKRLVSTEYGEISAVRVGDGVRGSYLLHFFTLEPNSLMLPVMLHSDMVFYVHTGSGKLSWTDEDDLKSADVRQGDVYRLREGCVFFLQSNLETETNRTRFEAQTERRKLRVHAIFADGDEGLHESEFGPYTNMRDMVLGFDSRVLQAAFKVPAEVIEELFNGTEVPAIIHGVSKNKRTVLEMGTEFARRLVQIRSYGILDVGRKSKKLFNLFKEDKDFKNCNGWSTTVTGKKLSALKGSHIGLFMVNLTIGSMMGPHWNPTATEVAVVLQGRGMVRVVCPSTSKETACRNVSFEVEEGDVFVVPRFHAMAQMAFTNDTFVFMGFITSTRRNHPQYLAGRASVLRTLDKDVVAMSFNVTNTTLDQLLAPQRDSIILRCVSCAEEESRAMQEEKERDKEEAREREEEEARKRQEETRREEEEERKRQEEAARRQEEERKRREEEERKRQEEDRKKQDEEEKKQRKQREGEEEKKRREEAEREEEEWKQQKEKEKERQREEGEEARSREEQEQAAKEERRREEEAQREEEEARQQKRERRRQEEKEEEEEETRRQETERRRQEEREEGEEEQDKKKREDKKRGKKAKERKGRVKERKGEVNPKHNTKFQVNNNGEQS